MLGSRRGLHQTRAWALAFIATLLALGGCRDDEAPNVAREEAAAPKQEMPPQQQALMEKLHALGYLQGSEPASDASGVTIHERGRAQPGLNLVVDAHAPTAVLLDMDGRELHRWSRTFHSVWPDRESKDWFRGDRYWRHAELLPDGSLLAIFDGLGLIKLDRNSELSWAYPGRAHHDLAVRGDGSILVLTRASRVIPRVHPTQAVEEDFVVTLDADGRELRKLSLFQAVARSGYADWLDQLRPKGDIFHTNALELLDGRLAHLSDAFRAGNVLVSLHMLHAIAAVDLDTGRVAWALRGSWRNQHDPTVVGDRNILLFDNLGTPRRSSVLEVDAGSGEEKWRYQKLEPGAFYSFCCGTSRRLPNGNTLITESGKGRAFEIDGDDRIVWEYWTPHRVAATRPDAEEKIAMLFEVQRLPEDFARGWLPSSDVR